MVSTPSPLSQLLKETLWLGITLQHMPSQRWVKGHLRRMLIKWLFYRNSKHWQNTSVSQVRQCLKRRRLQVAFLSKRMVSGWLTVTFTTVGLLWCRSVLKGMNCTQSTGLVFHRNRRCFFLYAASVCKVKLFTHLTCLLSPVKTVSELKYVFNERLQQ